MKPQWQRQQEQMRRQQEQMRKQQEQMRRQQEQMRKQQEQRRRQMEGAAWQQQQKARAEKVRPHALPEQRGKDRFAQIEAEVSRLRQDLAANRLTEEQFKARLRELMVEDEQGNWWMLGYETGQWYRHDGSGWVRADPQPLAQAIAPAKPKPQRFWDTKTFQWGLSITFLVGLVVGGIVGESTDSTDTSCICTSVIWLGGLILATAIASKVRW
jgi:hypothetical protein